MDITRRGALALMGISALGLNGCGATGNSSSGSSPSSTESGSKTQDKHVDEFTMVDAHIEPDDGYGYFDMVITARNETDEPKKLLGIAVSELDSKGNIINSYYSYNKNSAEAVVEPGQEASIPLTCSEEDGIAGVQCAEYEYGEFENPTKGKFSKIFKKMF